MLRSMKRFIGLTAKIPSYITVDGHEFIKKQKVLIKNDNDKC